MNVWKQSEMMKNNLIYLFDINWLICIDTLKTETDIENSWYKL